VGVGAFAGTIAGTFTGTFSHCNTIKEERWSWRSEGALEASKLGVRVGVECICSCLATPVWQQLFACLI
jgi:hypothetical protein